VRSEAQQLAPFLRHFRYVISDYGPTLKFAYQHSRRSTRKPNGSGNLPPLIQLSHQAALDSRQSSIPRPAGDGCGRAETWLGQQAIDLLRGDRNFGFHYEQYNENILPPLIRSDLLETSAAFDGDHVLVYVRSAIDTLAALLDSVGLPLEWRIYTPQVQQETKLGRRIWACPYDRRRFREDLLHCLGLFSDCGFGLSSEALHLGLPFVGRPIPNHYEQQCNAAALAEISDVGIVRDLRSETAIRILRAMFSSSPKDRQRRIRFGRLGEVGPFNGVAEQVAARIFHDN
jgi:hypothetical protein